MLRKTIAPTKRATTWSARTRAAGNTGAAAITAPSLYRHCTVTALSLHRHCTVISLSLHHHCTATVPLLQLSHPCTRCWICCRPWEECGSFFNCSKPRVGHHHRTSHCTITTPSTAPSRHQVTRRRTAGSCSVTSDTSIMPMAWRQHRFDAQNGLKLRQVHHCTVTVLSLCHH